MTNNLTRGPWRWKNHQLLATVYDHESSRYGVELILAASPGYLSDANARLIEASPELLDVLGMVADNMRQVITARLHPGGQKTNGGNGPYSAAYQIPSLLIAFKRDLQIIDLLVNKIRGETEVKP